MITMQEEFQYQVNLKNFAGPLDLLLFLVKEKRMNILEIDLVELTNQYLNYIKGIETKNFDNASEYLVMAATLLQLKSKILLQDPNDEQDIEETKQDLLQKLAEYQRFKQIKDILLQKELNRKKIFTKNPEAVDHLVKQIDESKLDGNSSLSKLLEALSKFFESQSARLDLQKVSVIETFNISPEKRASQIRKLLINSNQISFESLFFDDNNINLKQLSVTLLALLDMAKRQEIYLLQEKPFSEIKIVKGAHNE